jgi:putative phosphoserine phosphatase/1-acylglycerol-3-phosphate O-acyltransferase
MRRVRSLAGMASVLPIGAAALGVGLLSRNRRRGVNVLTSQWPAAVLALNRVTLNVIGAENLTKARPAVFVFNHRNNFDPFMVASLVKTNYTGVAKKELADSRIAGPIGRLMDVAFIDRTNSASAIASMSAMQELLDRGISVLIAPEGTRLDTDSVGPFKMGAFYMALATQTPIVPVVIRNAERVAGRNATSLNAGLVDIAVLPPVPVTDWKRKTLRDHRTEVRELFVRTLKDWPDRTP